MAAGVLGHVSRPGNKEHMKGVGFSYIQRWEVELGPERGVARARDMCDVS